MKLTHDNVHELVLKCLFAEGEEALHHTAKHAEGVALKLGFHPGRLEEAKPQIIEMLRELPVEFHKGFGGGYTFLSLPFRRDSTQWGEQKSADELLCLAIASGLGEILLPRDLWAVLPGGVPYVGFTLPG